MDKIRIHGDYHLGQVLRADGDYVIVDFEGNPARPLSDIDVERARDETPGCGSVLHLDNAGAALMPRVHAAVCAPGDEPSWLPRV